VEGGTEGRRSEEKGVEKAAARGARTRCLKGGKERKEAVVRNISKRKGWKHERREGSAQNTQKYTAIPGTKNRERPELKRGFLGLNQAPKKTLAVAARRPGRDKRSSSNPGRTRFRRGDRRMFRERSGPGIPGKALRQEGESLKEGGKRQTDREGTVH